MHKLILAVAALMLSASVAAHHAGGHRVLAIGVETEVPIQVLACDKEKALRAVFRAQREDGLRAAATLLSLLSRTPSEDHPGEALCGSIAGFVTVREQLHAELLPGVDGTTYIVRLTMRRKPDRVYVAAINVEDILPADRAGELGADEV